MLLNDTPGIVMDLFWKTLDLLPRIRNFVKRRSARMAIFSEGRQLSDSEVTFYETAVDSIVGNPKRFKRFRRIYDYREILEHVNYKQGRVYLNQALKSNFASDYNLISMKKNDLIGKPRKLYYSELGFVSPTTLRYVATALDIMDKMSTNYFPKIIEIGGGYGGQAVVLNTMKVFDSYSIYDLPNVQDLIWRYSSSLGCESIEFPDKSTKPEAEYDLLISNFAFSELPKELQIHYLENVVSKAKFGYMLMNSGRHNLTGRSVGKLSLEELKMFIPNLEVSEEFPKTSPDNYLITWKS
jgi:hypothetical protein